MRDLGSIEDMYPLSPLQRGILFHTLDSPSQYLSLSCTAIRGDLDADAFERAWRMLVARHAVLRSSFLYEDLPEPIQIVHRTVNLSMRRLDWQDRSAHEQALALDALLASETSSPFDIEVAPLIRLTLVSVTQGRWLFVWTTHHILLDAWSSNILTRELRRCYRAIVDRRDPDLPPAVPFRTYVAWLKAQDRREAEQRWRAHLEDFTEPTPLPGAHAIQPRPHAAFEVAHARRALTVDDTAAVKRYAREHHLTLSTVVQGAWALLLGRHAGVSKVTYGTAVSGRPPSLTGAESIVGPLINTIPVRVQVDDSRPIAVWLRELQNEQVQIREFDYISLIDLRRWSGLEASRSLFDSIFTFHNVPWEIEPGCGWRFESVEGGARESSNYPLGLVVSVSDQLRLRITYDVERFSSDTIADLLHRLERVLVEIVDRPDASARTIQVLSPAECTLITVDTALADLSGPFQFH